jgi:hypothetical protein
MSNKLQHISDNTVRDVCEKLLTNLSVKHYPQGFVESSYLVFLVGVPEIDDTTAEAYNEAALLAEMTGGVVPQELKDANRGFSIAQVNPVVLAQIGHHVGAKDMTVPRLITVMTSLCESGTPGVDARAYGNAAVLISVYHRETPDGGIIVVEYSRPGGLNSLEEPSMFTARQCITLEDTADDEGCCQHMLIPDEWYPLHRHTAAATGQPPMGIHRQGRAACENLGRTREVTMNSIRRLLSGGHLAARP